MSSNPRVIAYKALMKVSRNAGYSNIVFNNEIKNSSLAKIDVSLAAAIFYGVLERRLTLDYVISLYSSTRLEKMSDDVVNILRMGVYQIIFMQKIPDSAAVNESVKLAKGPKRIRGFINAVLRSVARNKKKISYPDDSILYSCPKWLVEFFGESYGKEIANKILNSFLGKPDLVVRVNTLKTNKEDLLKRFLSRNIKASIIFESLDALKLENTHSIEQLSEFNEGLFHVQDIASQICCKVVNPLPGEVVVDVCAAPGGKTFTASQMMDDVGKIFAFDLYESKINLISSGAKRLGVSIIDAQVKDSSIKFEKEGFADKVICDVPCSGLGIIKRKPEIRYKNEDWFDGLPDVQIKILENSAKLLRVGGVLTYSTCTLNPKENSKVVEKFLSENDNFIASAISLPGGVVRTVNEKDSQLTLIPGENDSDGFFISCVKRVK